MHMYIYGFISIGYKICIGFPMLICIFIYMEENDIQASLTQVSSSVFWMLAQASVFDQRLMQGKVAGGTLINVFSRNIT